MLFTASTVYLDDVLILSKNVEQHLSHFQMVFYKFRQANLRMNGMKCNFAVEQVKYLGHILSAESVAVDPGKAEIITNWPRPKTA